MPTQSPPLDLNPLAFQNAPLLGLIADAASHEISTVSGLALRLGRDESNVRKTIKILIGEDLLNPDPLMNGLTPRGAEQLAAIRRAENPTAAGPGPVRPGDLIRLHPTQLRPDPANPRRAFSEAELEDLAASIAERGVQQSLRIRPLSPLPPTDDAYPGQAHLIISGERRWRASMKVLAAGEWPEGQTIPCIIASPEDEAEALEDALAENMVRQDLNHMEMAEGFEKLAQAGRENADIARAVGKSVGFVQQHRRLVRLDPVQQKAVADGTLSLHDALRILSGKPPTEPDGGQAPAEVGFALDITLNSSWGLNTDKPCRATLTIEKSGTGLWRATLTYQAGVGEAVEGRTAHPEMAWRFESRDAAIRNAAKGVGRLLPDGRPRELTAWLDMLMGPHFVDLVDFGNATNAQERRYVIGWDQRPAANSGSGRKAEGGAAASMNPPDHDPLNTLSPEALLLLCELTHKIADARAPLVLSDDVHWSGDAVSDYAAFGAPIGTHWTDATFRELQAAGLVRAVTLPGGTPPLGALTDAGIAAFVKGSVPLPPSQEQLERRQRAEGMDPAPHRYLSPLLVHNVRPATTLKGELARLAGETPSPAARISGNLDADPWDRTPEQEAADQALLAKVRDLESLGFVAGGLADLNSFHDLGVFSVSHNAEGWIELRGADDAVITEIVVDQNSTLPDHRTVALELLVLRALTSVLGAA